MEGIGSLVFQHFTVDSFILLFSTLISQIAQSAGAVEYVNRTSAEE